MILEDIGNVFLALQMKMVSVFEMSANISSDKQAILTIMPHPRIATRIIFVFAVLCRVGIEIDRLVYEEIDAMRFMVEMSMADLNAMV